MPMPYSSLRTVSLLAVLGISLQAHGATVTVTTTNDDLINGDGQCTLREAMTAINNGADFQDCVHTGSAWGTTDTIAFAIGGAGPHVIQPASALPALTRTAVVDGYSQPGSSPNTLAGVGASAQGINAQIQIELDGVSAGSGVSGLVVNGANSLIQGLSIVRFGAGSGGAGILIIGAGAQVYGNFLGLHADGVTSGGNGYGVSSHATGASVGSSSFVASSRNVIAANAIADVLVTRPTNSIYGNLICTDRTGQAVAGSGGVGVMIAGDAGDVDSNTISGCGTDGVLIFGGQSNTVHNNAIGLAVGGTGLGNGSAGGLITNSSSSATASGNQFYLNQIAYNGGDGIAVQNMNGWGDPINNRLDSNSIWSNGGLGINLIPTGEASGVVTPNDAGDADTGPNGLANFPVVGSAVVNASGGVDIAFTLNSVANASVWISAYANDSCDPSGHGEGQHHSGSNPIYSLDGTGNLSVTRTINAPLPAGWAVGKWVTLLAHGATTGGTSEFSACAQITGAAPVAQVITNFAANPAAGTWGGSSTLSATGGGSGNPVVFGSLSPSICTVLGNVVSFLSAGTCTVTANQAGNGSYGAAPQVTLDIPVSGLAAQSITNFAANPASGTVGGSSALSATGGGSGNPLVFGSSTPAVCTVSGSTVSYLSVGTCTVTADQSGDSVFAAAPQVSLGIPVSNLSAQSISNFLANPASGMVGGSSALSATGGGSGNPVVFGSSTPTVCTVSGSTVSYLSAGTCTVTADQAGNGSYGAAPQVSLSLTVSAGGGNPAAIPTLTEWALMLLSTLFGWLGIQGTRSGRRRQI